LYHGVPVYLCPGPTTQPLALDSVRSLWSGLGATCTILEAGQHDELMAWVSHLPQIVSTAIAGVLAEAGRVPGELGPGGRDMTRLAGSSPEMWEAICLSNSGPIGAAIARLRDRLDRIEEAVQTRDAATIRDFFRAGRDWLEP
jgi:prephenate dehydrogenase